LTSKLPSTIVLYIQTYILLSIYIWTGYNIQLRICAYVYAMYACCLHIHF
jgi:hypothetical protein